MKNSGPASVALSDLFSPASIKLNLAGNDRDAVLAELYLAT